MKIQDIVPNKVINQIKADVKRISEKAQDAWDAGCDEEDTLTGDFCSCFRSRGWRKISDEKGKDWKYRFTYKKFRSKGKNADEKIFGADGIFEIEVTEISNGSSFKKGLLFQAKKHNDSGRKKLLEQACKMNEIVPNASSIFEYGRVYKAYDSKDLLQTAEKAKNAIEKVPMGDYLADRFLECKVGKDGMTYDAVSKVIVYPYMNSIRRVKATLHHRIRIEVISS